MVGLIVPPASADATEHADWLELTAAVTSDATRSRQHLIAAIRRTGSIDGAPSTEDLDDEPLDELVEREDEELERISEAAFEQLARRESYLGEHYPFAVDGTVQAKDGALASPYLFLTALTKFNPTLRASEESGASLFERVSRTALVEYLGGVETVRSYDFGFPRRDGPKAFYDALEALCQQMGEGLGCKVKRPKTASVKDAKLDLVAWLPFEDGRDNQLSVFGQCAAGMDWSEKVNELQPVDFCRIWLKESPAMSPLLAFFVPRQVEDHAWFQVSVGERRIFFDRLRIARFLGRLDQDLAKRCEAWTAAAIAPGDAADAPVTAATSQA